VLSDPEESAAVHRGDKTIHQAAQDAKTKQAFRSSSVTKLRRRSKATGMSDENALAEGHRLFALVNALAASDPNERRRSAYKSAVALIRKALR
jgi:hypothetical protein